MGHHVAQDGERIEPQTGRFWKVFWILLAITSIEFIIAFTVDADHFKWTKIIAFIILTLVKAYYIVAIFMHLGDEVKSLIWSIVLPVMFVIWLIVALIIEGGYIGSIR